MLGCIKYLVILYNLILWLLGISILGLAIFFYVDTLKYIDISSSSWPIYSSLFMVVIAIGILVAIVGFLGCCGAIKESSCMLGLYFLICLVVCGSCGAALIWAEQNTLPVKGYLQEDIRKIIQKNYSKQNDTSITNMIIDKIQTDFQCCGSTNYTDWSNSWQNNGTGRPDIGVNGNGPAYISAGYPQSTRQYSTSNQQQIQYATSNNNNQGMSQLPQSQIVSTTFRVPLSCCSTRNENQYQQCKQAVEKYDGFTNQQLQQVMQRIPGVNADGCVDRIHSYLTANSLILIIIGGVCIGLQFLAIVFACTLCCAINRAISRGMMSDEEK